MSLRDIKVLGLRRYVWARFFYRHVMRLMHRLDWCYMERLGPFEDGSSQRWCHWCGNRVTLRKPSHVIEPPTGGAK